MKKEVLTTFDAADFCHVSYMSVKRWIWAGRLKAFKTPGGHFRIYRNDLIDFMRGNEIPVPQDAIVIRKRVLIVEGDETAREGIADYLRMNGPELEVATARDAYDAGAMVGQFRPDIILLDLMMPHLDGFSVCERLKKSPLTHDIRIIVMTGFDTVEENRRVHECGADKILAKPVELKILFAQIRALLRDGKA